MIDAHDIAEKTRDGRKALGISQAELAARAGVSLPTITRLEGGFAHRIAFGTVVRVLDIVGYDLFVEKGVAPAAALGEPSDERQYILKKFYFGGDIGE